MKKEPIDIASLDALFLDVGGTLIRTRSGVGGVYAEVAHRHGLVLEHDAATINARFLAAFQRAKQASLETGRLVYGRTEDEARAFWYTVVEQVFAPWEGKTAVTRAVFEELYSVFARPDVWDIFPGTLPLLRAAKDIGLRLAAVSNWDARLDSLLESLGLAQHFDTIVGSYSVGAQKPDGRIFRVALTALGLEDSPGRVLHVGDTYDEDVVGAQRAGLKAVHLDRKNQFPDAPDRIPSLRALARSQK